MTQPTVCAIMLVNGREEMVKRAIKSFREQTYQNKRMLIWDSTPDLLVCDQNRNKGICHVPAVPKATIGEMRNAANWFWTEYPILCHWDSDDWSHPRRIEEQVALLQASGKSCVGYKDMLFYDTTPGQFCGAWLYRHPTKPLGTSLCYWRSAWEARPFPDLPKVKGGTGEDVQWLEGVDHVAISSLGVPVMRSEPIDVTRGGLFGGPADTHRRFIPGIAEEAVFPHEPRMIASIHGGNTQYYKPAEMERLSEGTSWRRAAEWDEHCRKVMAL